MATVLVTGASGFLGGHVLRELRGTGCSVRALSRRPETDAALAALGAEPVRGDLDDPAALRRAVDGCDAVSTLPATPGCGRRTPRASLKPTSVARSGCCARLIMMIDRGTLPGVPPGAGSFADVREVARAHVQAWQRGRFGQGYLLGGEHASFVDFARRVGERLGRRTPARPLPRWLLMGIAQASDVWGRLRRREPDVTPEGAALTSHRLKVDAGRAVRELDDGITPLDVLLDDTIAWMRAEGMVGR